MKFLPIVALAFLGGLTISNTPTPHHFAYVGLKCMTSESPISVLIGGVTVGTVADADFTAGSSCTVIPPPDVPSSVALRCTVSAGASTITASTGLTLGTTAPSGEWCVEVRTVAQ